MIVRNPFSYLLPMIIIFIASTVTASQSDMMGIGFNDTKEEIIKKCNASDHQYRFEKFGTGSEAIMIVGTINDDPMIDRSCIILNNPKPNLLFFRLKSNKQIPKAINFLTKKYGKAEINYTESLKRHQYKWQTTRDGVTIEVAFNFFEQNESTDNETQTLQLKLPVPEDSLINWKTEISYRVAPEKVIPDMEAAKNIWQPRPINCPKPDMSAISVRPKKDPQTKHFEQVAKSLSMFSQYQKCFQENIESQRDTAMSLIDQLDSEGKKSVAKGVNILFYEWLKTQSKEKQEIREKIMQSVKPINN